MDRLTGTIQRRFNIGTPKASEPELIRKIGEPLRVTEEGAVDLNSDRIWMNPATGEQVQITNFTTDRPVVSHPLWKHDMFDTYVINPKSLSLRDFVSIDPADTFIPGTIDPVKLSNVTLISGDPAALQAARNQGLDVLSSPRLRRLWKDAYRQGHSGFRNSMPDINPDFAAEVQRLKSTRGNPTMHDYNLLEEITGLKSHVEPNTGQYIQWRNSPSNVPFGELEPFVYPDGTEVDLIEASKDKWLGAYDKPYNSIIYNPLPTVEWDWRTAKGLTEDIKSIDMQKAFRDQFKSLNQ